MIAIAVTRLLPDGSPDVGTVALAIPDIRRSYRLIGGVWALQDWLPISATTDLTGTAVLDIPDPSAVRPSYLAWTIRLSATELWYGRFQPGDAAFLLTDLPAMRGFVPVLSPPVRES